MAPGSNSTTTNDDNDHDDDILLVEAGSHTVAKTVLEITMCLKAILPQPWTQGYWVPISLP